jgi:hypothetical protein
MLMGATVERGQPEFLLKQFRPNLYATDAGLKAGLKSRPMGPEWVKWFNEQGVRV